MAFIFRIIHLDSSGGRFCRLHVAFILILVCFLWVCDTVEAAALIFFLFFDQFH